MIKHILQIEFSLELQWILRLAFSPMQLDFESAPFSRLGTSPYLQLGYYISTPRKNQGFSLRFFFASSRIAVICSQMAL